MKKEITALYERLSVDDGQAENESNSIQNQKMQLEEYAKANGFKNIVHYTDDGESGRFFDRPGYVRIMDDIESGKVAEDYEKTKAKKNALRAEDIVKGVFVPVSHLPKKEPRKAEQKNAADLPMAANQ